jgi:hypothetical protein
MEDSNAIYGEIDVNTKINLSKEAKDKKITELSALAKKIWKRIIEINLKKEYPQEMLLNVMQSEYNEFFLSFPLVLRWMVEANQFKITAFNRYLEIFLDSDIKSKKDFLKLQGKYLVILYKELNPTLPEEKIILYEEEINNLLFVEDETFKQMEEEALEEIKEESKKASNERKEYIYNMILRKKAMSGI